MRFPPLRMTARLAAGLPVTGLLAIAVLLAGCSNAATTQTLLSTTTVTVDNCGEKVDFPSPTERLFVNDSNLISMILALGAEDQVAAVSSLERDQAVLTEHYGDAVAALPDVSTDYPTLETVIAARPDVMVAGWNYGYSETKNVTPDTLAQHNIGAYILSESCRQAGTSARGVMDPWTALRTDLTNLGQITGHTDEAEAVVADLDHRLDALRAAPKSAKPPTVFVFDSGEKAVFTSGAFGAPQAVIDAAGGHNAMADLKDTWTEVSWERLAASRPDAFVFVDYPGQSFEQKVAVLKNNPATRDLPAVQEGRFLNLPYVMWTSGPLNIDAAEQMRTALEDWKLIASDH